MQTSQMFPVEYKNITKGLCTKDKPARNKNGCRLTEKADDGGGADVYNRDSIRAGASREKERNV